MLIFIFIMVQMTMIEYVAMSCHIKIHVNEQCDDSSV